MFCFIHMNITHAYYISILHPLFCITLLSFINSWHINRTYFSRSNIKHLIFIKPLKSTKNVLVVLLIAYSISSQTKHHIEHLNICVNIFNSTYNKLKITNYIACKKYENTSVKLLTVQISSYLLLRAGEKSS